MMGAADRLALWTVYDSPRDLPGRFVARRFLADRVAAIPTADVIEADSLHQIRAQLLDRGLAAMFPRQAGDDPAIVETWI